MFHWIRLSDSIRGAFIANTMSQASSSILQLLGLPILLHAWGEVNYGSWIIVLGFSSNAAFLDFGLLQASSNNILITLASGNCASARAWYLAGRRFALYFFCVVSFGLIFSSFFLSDFLKSFFNHDVDVRVLSVLLLGYIWSLLVFNYLNGLIRVVGGNSTAAWLAFLGVFFDGISPILAGLLNCTLLTGVLLMFFFRFVLVVLSFFIFPGLKFFGNTEQRDFSGINMRALLRPAAANIIIPAWSVLSVQLVIVTIAKIFGVAEVGRFSAVRTLSRLPFQLYYVIVRSMQIGVVRSLVSGDRTSVISSLKRVTYAYAFFILFGGFAFLLIGPIFISYWSHDKYLVDFGYLLPFYVILIFHAFWQSALSILNGMNRHFEISILIMFFGLMFFALIEIFPSYILLMSTWIAFEFIIALYSVLRIRSILS